MHAAQAAQDDIKFLREREFIFLLKAGSQVFQTGFFILLGINIYLKDLMS
jgi:hypothetical protein